MDKKTLKNTIKKANIQYRIGEPIEIQDLPIEIQDILEQKDDELTDKSYDFLIDLLYKIDPNDEIFDDGIIEKEISSSRKEKLDKPMYSLDKMKSVPDVIKWGKKKGLKDNTIIIATAKYDGVSSLNNEKTLNAHSRGDGIEGQNITGHINKYNKYKPSSFEFYTIGELIIPIQVFKDNNFIRDNGEVYKNPRNMVAGLVNNDDVSPYWEFVDHIRYGIADEEFDYDKLDHIKIIKKETGFDVPYEKFTLSELTTEKLDELYYKWGEKYEIDGIVLDVNDKDIRKKLGRERNNNPSYAIAYKSDWVTPTKTVVRFNFWDVSKEGYVKPVVNIVPFDIEGVTISKATGYNAKFILDNKIGVGSVVEIIRSGSVIPKIVNIPEPTQSDIPTYCPSCNTKLIWNKTNVEIYCKNPDCETKNIKRIAFFFSSLDISDFGESIISKFYHNGYDKIGKILNMKLNDISIMDGMGTSSGTKILDQFDKIKNASFEKLGHASGCFENLGSRKIKMIIDGLGGMDGLEVFKKLYFTQGINKILIDKLELIKGVAETTAIAFMNGLTCFEKFTKDLGLEIKRKEITKSDISFKGRTFVFSGVRNKNLQTFITDNDGSVKSGVSKNTTDLVVKDANASTSKINKARDLGVNIIQIDELLKLIK